jgi:protein-disulfide isomerase
MIFRASFARCVCLRALDSLGMVRAMKLLTTALLMTLVAGCENTATSQLAGNAAAGAKGEAGDQDTAAIEATLSSMEERLTALEKTHEKGFEGGTTDAALSGRLQKIEANLQRREEALGFLEMAYSQQKRQQEAQEAQEPDPDAVFAVDISGPVKAGQTEGPADATVTIVKAFDFACPYCEKLNEPLHELVKENQGKVRVVYMNLVVHPDTAQLAHQYSCGAAKQGKYLAWKDAFWEKGFNAYAQSGGKDRAAMGEDNILKLSGDAGLDTQKLKADAASDECKQRVEADVAELRKFKVNGTPGLFINGKFIGGAIPKPQFQAIIDEKLKIAEASGVSGAEYYEKEIMGKGVHQFRSKRDAARKP